MVFIIIMVLKCSPSRALESTACVWTAWMVLEVFSSLYGSQWDLLLELLCRAEHWGMDGLLTVVSTLLHRVGVSGMEMDPGALCRGHKGLQRERKGNREQALPESQGRCLAQGRQSSCSGCALEGLGASWEPVGRVRVTPAVTPGQAPPALHCSTHPWEPPGRAGARNKDLGQQPE